MEYERLYKQYEGVAQPRVVGVKVNADLFPERRDVCSPADTGCSTESAEAIDSVHLQLPRTVEIRRLDFTRGAERVLSDEEQGLLIYRLAQPLPPGDSMALDFDLALPHARVQEPRERLRRGGERHLHQQQPAAELRLQCETANWATTTRAASTASTPKERMAKVDDLKARAEQLHLERRRLGGLRGAR